MNKSRAKVRSQKSYHHGDLRTALVKRARAVVEEEGPETLSLRGVAQSLDVSRAAPYHHFKDKQELLAAVAADGFMELTDNMIGKTNPKDDARARLDSLGYGYVDFGVRHPALFRLMQGPDFQQSGKYPELDEARSTSAAPLIETVADCLPGADQSKIMSACAAAWSIVHGMAALCVDGRLQTLVKTNRLRAAARSITSKLDLKSMES